MAGQIQKQEARRGQPWLAPWREEFEDLVSRVWGDEGDGWLTRGLATALDISETEQAVEIRMDLPGVKPKDVDIQVSGNTLTIRGERKEEQHEEKGRNFHRVERRYGSFSRTVTLPCATREDEASAEYHDGVLSIVLPKTEEAKTKKIKVKG